MTIPVSDPSFTSCDTTEHYSPPDLVGIGRYAMGGIDLDPATSEKANRECVGAGAYFTSVQNGLLQDWFGRVWLNPPGGMVDENGLTRLRGCEAKGHCGLKAPHVHPGTPCSSVLAWHTKLKHEMLQGRVIAATIVGFTLEALRLTPLLSPEFSTKVCILDKRVDFLEPRTLKPQTQPRHASCLIFVTRPEMRMIPPTEGERMIERFISRASRHGRILSL